MTKQLPDGVEWPRFEDGELVQYRDQIMHEGRPETVQAFYFNWPGHVILSLVGVDHEKLHHLFDGATVQRPPVLDKDGQEIKVGDTVWDKQGTRCVVKSIIRVGTDRPMCDCTYEYKGCVDRMYKNPCILTHTPPDSWEKLREDAQKSYQDYWGCKGDTCTECPALIDGLSPDDRYDASNCIAAGRLDILHRAEKLAGVMGSD